MLNSSAHDIKYYGCIVLSRALRKVLLVKPRGCASWSFPVDLKSGVEAAAAVVEDQTGIYVSDAIDPDDFIEVPFPPGASSLARLYIVHSIPRKEPFPSQDSSIDDVEWKDFRSIMELPESTPFEEAAVMPFLKELHQWVLRHHHLREMPDSEFGRAALFSSRYHSSRSLPTSVLATALRNNGLPDVEYIVFTPSEIMYADETLPRFSQPTFGCTCILPHIELSITPEICYLEREDAEQMAAMTGILYLSGGIDQQTKYFHFAPMRSPPPQKPFWNEMVAEHVKRHKEGALQNGQMSYWQNPGHNMIPPNKALQYKASLKTPVSMLEDFCTKKSYTLRFQFECKSKGYVGLITIPDLGFTQFDGEWKKHKRDAKECAATMMLDMLKERGMYVV